jgi:hypothetical protein
MTNVLMKTSRHLGPHEATVTMIELLRSFANELITVKSNPIQEGFFIKWMAVSITVDHKLIISHVLHKICLHIQGSKHRTYLQDKHSWDDSLAKHWLESSKVHLPVTWSSLMNQDFQEHSWVAKYWPPEVQDLSQCCWLSQVPPLPGASPMKARSTFSCALMSAPTRKNAMN